MIHPSLPKRVFVTGIGTDVGKTHCSAYLVAQWGAHYYKPLQAGLPRDADTVAKLAAVSDLDRIVPEQYLLQLAASPHEAAGAEGIMIRSQDIALPAGIDGPLVVEGAGGLLAPISLSETIADVAAALGLPILIVVRFYLGSINHTLLTLEAARARGLEVAGLALGGDVNEASLQAMQSLSQVEVVCRFPV